MAISMHQASVPQFKKMLNNLSSILKKGAEFAADKKIDEKVLVEFRLAPDMLPLAKQVQIACDQVKMGMSRLSGVEAPKHADTETTFAQLQDRITQTIAFIDGIKPEQIDGTEAKEIKFSIKEWHFEFTGSSISLPGSCLTSISMSRLLTTSCVTMVCRLARLITWVAKQGS